MSRTRNWRAAVAFVAAAGISLQLVNSAVRAANCDQTSVQHVPINDLGSGLYLNQFQGGLYSAGSNEVPAAHAAVGAQRAKLIQPLNVAGEPDPAGRYILLSIGMSNTTQEYQSFLAFTNNNPQVNHGGGLRIIDGAAGGQTASTWDSPSDLNYNRIRDEILIPQGLSEAQVQAAWVKVANAGPTNSLPNANADAFTLFGQQGNIARALKVRYPNLQVVFFSTRIYAGYASTQLNPEPYAYETAFGVKWLIESQINQMNGGGINPIAGDLDYNSVVPWLSWGPYLWADGLIPRSDGLIWQCSDLANDGTHPSPSGRQKVASMLLAFMLNSPFAQGWFASGLPAGDVTGDGSVDVSDLLFVINNWGPCPPPGPGHCPGDVSGNNGVEVADLLIVINNWS